MGADGHGGNGGIATLKRDSRELEQAVEGGAQIRHLDQAHAGRRRSGVLGTRATL